MKSGVKTHRVSERASEAARLEDQQFPDVESRLLLLTVPGGDSGLAESLTRGGFRVHACARMTDLCREINIGAGAALLSAGALSGKALAELQRCRSEAPPWSDLPLVVVGSKTASRRGDKPLAAAMSALGSFHFLELPVERETALEVIHSALRVRRRQYQVRDLLRQCAGQVHEVTEQMDAFTYSVSHDLRAPLRAIRGFAQALLEDYGAALDDTGRDYLGRMADGAEHLEQLIQDLLQYSRLSRAELAFGPVHLEHAVQAALQQLDEEIHAAGAEVEIRKPLPRMLAHEATLQQVVACLLANAIKFGLPGVKPRVRIWAESRGGRVRLWIADNGIGIAPAHHQRIFKVFERLHGVETYPGTGMGLAIVAKGVARMGGAAGVESALDQGSQFWIELPRFRRSES